MKPDLRQTDPLQPKKPQRMHYSLHYSTHFSKLKEYVLKGKIRKSFKDGDFRSFLRDDGVNESTSSKVKYSLGFFCREDIGLCTYDEISRRYVLKVDAKEFRTKNFKDLQTYIEYKGIDYIEPKSDHDKKMREDRLATLRTEQLKHENNQDLEQKVSLGKSMVHAFEERVSNC